MIWFKRFATIYFLIYLLSGCQKATVSEYISTIRTGSTPVAMIGYVDPNTLQIVEGHVSPIREKALSETAIALGATGGLAWRSAQINAQLAKNARELDTVFDFNQLLIGPNILPPVLVEANNELNLANAETIRLASKIYKIIAPARFITAPPTWRVYLELDFKKPEMPDHSLFPKNQEEANIWNACLVQGWKQGIQQAEAIFAENLNRLKRDYSGIILYRKLYAQKIVSAPFVAKAELGVTGNGREIRINDEVLRITGQAELQPDSSQWEPVITDPENY